MRVPYNYLSLDGCRIKIDIDLSFQVKEIADVKIPNPVAQKKSTMLVMNIVCFPIQTLILPPPLFLSLYGYKKTKKKKKTKNKK